jgi:hypothetical protein
MYFSIPANWKATYKKEAQKDFLCENMYILFILSLALPGKNYSLRSICIFIILYILIIFISLLYTYIIKPLYINISNKFLIDLIV